MKPATLFFRIPRVDYANHPAYGKLFGAPSFSLRIKALKCFLPHFFRQVRLAIKERRQPIYLSELLRDDVHHLPLLPSLRRDGIVALHLDNQEMAQIKHYTEPFITLLQKHKYSIAPEKRTFKDKVLAVHRSKAVKFYTDLTNILKRHQVISTLSYYRNVPLAVSYIYVHISDPDDLDWRNHFIDIGLPDPKSVYMHFDSTIQSMKCLLYLTPVTAENGPFCHVQGSNRIKKGFLEYVARKANDQCHLDGCDPETRKLFYALPKFFQHKSEFGNDLIDTDVETQEMLTRERQFTTDNGNLILFDTDSLHRGGMIKEGRRIMLQIGFKRSSSKDYDSFDKRMIGM